MSAREWKNAEAEAAFNESNRNMPHTADGITVGLIGRALLTLRHERNLLAAECRAGRVDKKYANCASEEAYQLARAAVDAAGVLGRE